MPLRKGKSNEVLQENIRELMHSYKKGGRFAKGKSPAKARQMAVAAAFAMRQKSAK